MLYRNALSVTKEASIFVFESRSPGPYYESIDTLRWRMLLTFEKSSTRLFHLLLSSASVKVENFRSHDCDAFRLVPVHQGQDIRRTRGTFSKVSARPRRLVLSGLNSELQVSTAKCEIKIFISH